MLQVLLWLLGKDMKIKLITGKAFSINLPRTVHLQGIHLFWLLLILPINELFFIKVGTDP